ncbi:IclR family transcriptional regulator [Ramlibacter sp.]|uniref:IclR family transcriptional regulator n=1 Tax=Ramlibacter sp. TaxID=1917967 RepID=UPI002FC688C1
MPGRSEVVIPKQTVGASSARKILKLLTYFTPDRTHARVEDLAAHVDVPKSTAYRHLALLKETGLIASGADGRWHLAPALIRLGEAARSAVGIIELALPAMQRLSHQTQETVLLIERIGDAGVCVAKQDAPQMIRLSFEVGTGVPLHRGAGAKLLLAHLSLEEQQRYWAHATANYADLKGRVTRLKSDLEEIRAAGHSVSSGDLMQDLWSVAAPVRRGSEVVAALSLVGPIYRMPPSAKPQLVDAVKRSADEISAEISRRAG